MHANTSGIRRAMRFELQFIAKPNDELFSRTSIRPCRKMQDRPTRPGSSNIRVGIEYSTAEVLNRL